MVNHVTIFSRVAGMTVNKALAPENRDYNHDRAQMLINNMNMINETLIQMGIKLIRKSRKYQHINQEELTDNFKEIIHFSILSYVKRAH